MDEAFQQRLRRVQDRICGPWPELPGTPTELLRQLRSMIREASDEQILQNQPHEAFQFVKQSEPPPAARAVPGALAIVGGEKNQQRGKDRKHFLRADGAWFDFTITVAPSQGSLTLLAYDFEMRFPGPRPPEWIRFDLNLPGHANETDGMRSHLHPGNDDLQVPAPVLSPLELLDLFLHGLEVSQRPRQRGALPGN